CWSACLKSDSNSMSLYTNLTNRTRMRNGHKPAVGQISVLMLACGLAAAFSAGCAGRGGAGRGPRATQAMANERTAPASPLQLNAAYDKLDSDDINAWALYRVGLSQQRLGQFAQADQTFAAVQQFHPNSVPAQRAREHQGARAFYVQLATFASPASADNAAADLRRLGVAANRVSDAQGRALLRAGPIASYSQAQYLRARFADKYPDAFVIP